MLDLSGKCLVEAAEEEKAWGWNVRWRLSGIRVRFHHRMLVRRSSRSSGLLILIDSALIGHWVVLAATWFSPVLRRPASREAQQRQGTWQRPELAVRPGSEIFRALFFTITSPFRPGLTYPIPIYANH